MKHWTVTSNDGSTFIAVADEQVARELADNTPGGANVARCSCGAEDVHGCASIRRPQPAMYWSEQGMIGCEDHVPMKGSDTWVFDRWERIPDDVVKGEGLVCETCQSKQFPKLRAV